MTEKQYLLVLNLYHDYEEAFLSLGESVKEQFFDLLFSRKGFIPTPQSKG